MNETALAVHAASGLESVQPFDELVALALQTVAPILGTNLCANVYPLARLVRG